MIKNKSNMILDTDSYKASHFRQFPPGTTKTWGYLESRVGSMYPETLFFGLQQLLVQYFEGAIITAEDVEEAAAFFKKHGEPFPREGWDRIVNVHGGRIPLRIMAVPEGTVVPIGNVLMSAESTDPELPWVVGWFETQLMRLWYPITVATRSFYCKRVIMKHLMATSDNPAAELPFKLHDFGGRGVSSRESAGIGGMAHLVNFKGSDTIEGICYADEFYGTAEPTSGFSIPAMEHSTVTSWGKDGEENAFRNMINQNHEYPLVACVSDSYDLFNAVGHIWAEKLNEYVIANKKCVVIRPDSGDACEINLKLLQLLEQKIGMKVNSKGFKVLPDHFRIIQGDGNDTEADIERVLSTLEFEGYSASNIAFGMGGGLLQKLDRDTQRFAFKISEVTIDGVATPICKNPSTDPTKASKAGRLDLVAISTDGVSSTFKTIQRSENETQMANLSASPNDWSRLSKVFENGHVFNRVSLDQVRALAASYL